MPSFKTKSAYPSPPDVSWFGELISSQLDSKSKSWKVGSVKTTLDLPDDLLRAMKIRAVQEGRKFKDVAAEVFRNGLAQPRPAANPAPRQRVKLPLIHCPPPVDPTATLTVDQVAEVLMKQEATWSHEAARR